MPTSASKTLRENLLRVIETEGISQSELARRTGTQARAINRLVGDTGGLHSPTLETLEQLAKGLQVSVSELLAPGFKPQSTRSAVEPDTPPLVVKQLSRLLEDFLACDADGRKQILALASCHADERDNVRRKGGA